MTVYDWIILAAVGLYMLMMLLVGLSVSNKNRTVSDFYLGGRKLGPVVTAMSAEASDMSSWLLMGLPGVALMTGVAEAFWTALGLAVGTYLNWLFVAKRLRHYSEKVGAVTVPEFFAKRFGDKKDILSAVSAVVIIIFFIPYVASGFTACGKLFSGMFGMDYMTAMIISAVVILIYCTVGGFLAVSTTDLIQSVVMTVALFVILSLSEGFTGGFDKIFASVGSLDGFLDVFRGFDVASGKAGSYGALPVVSTLAWGLGYFGMPHILLRFMAIDDPNKLKTSRRIASVWVVISMAIAVLIGIAGYALMQKGIVGPYADQAAAESVIVGISSYISRLGFLPAFVAGIFLSGILASAMSTADSQLIAASSSVTQDILVNTCKLKLSNKATMIIARVSVIVISVIAIFLASDPNSSVFKIVSFAWAGFGAAFGPVILLALFWKRTNKIGALAGMLAGGGMVFVWKFLVRTTFAGSWLDIYELLPAFLFGLLVTVVVSALTKKPDAEVTAAYDEVKATLKA